MNDVHDYFHRRNINICWRMNREKIFQYFPLAFLLLLQCMQPLVRLLVQLSVKEMISREWIWVKKNYSTWYFFFLVGKCKLCSLNLTWLRYTFCNEIQKIQILIEVGLPFLRVGEICRKFFALKELQDRKTFLFSSYHKNDTWKISHWLHETLSQQLREDGKMLPRKICDIF